jgi:ABC-2 type transport system permease protein
MIRLTKVELRRLFSRRLTAIALLGALVLTGLMLFGTFQQAKPLSGADLTAQRAQFDQAHKDWEANGAQQAQDCLKAQATAQKSDPGPAWGAASWNPSGRPGASSR